MIKNIYLKNLRNNEFVQFFENLQEIVLSNNPETLKVQEQYSALNKSLALLQLTHKKNTGSSYSEQLAQLDRRRDIALSSIYNVIETYTNHFNADVCSAAVELKKELDVYGRDIVKYNYQYETNAIEDILAKWELKPERIASVNLTDWVGELKEANILFNTRFLDRVKETAEDNNIKVVELRNIIVEAYNELIGFIKAYAMIEKTEVYTKTIDQINALINQYNKMLRARLSKKSTGMEVEDDENSDIDTNTTGEN